MPTPAPCSLVGDLEAGRLAAFVRRHSVTRVTLVTLCSIEGIGNRLVWGFIGNCVTSVTGASQLGLDPKSLACSTLAFSPLPAERD